MLRPRLLFTKQATAWDKVGERTTPSVGMTTTIDDASFEPVLCSSHNVAPKFDSTQFFVAYLLVSVLGGGAVSVLCLGR